MKNQKELFKHLAETNHKLVTRRDFLSHGLIAFGAVTALPSIFGLGLRSALAAECGGESASNMVPFMVFDMAGGAALPANFLVGNKGGAQDLIKSYNLLGWDPRASGALNTDFGLPMSAKYSKILEGILQNASAAARANFRMGSICHFAQDDTSSNKLNAAALALKAGFRGMYVANGISLEGSLSGGNSAGVIESAAFRPTQVRNINDVLGATSFGGTAFNGAGVSKLKALAEGAARLSRVQKEAFMAMTGGPEMGELSKCAYEKSLEFVSGVQGLDPRQDEFAQRVYQINGGTDASSRAAVAAALTMNTLKGYSGPSTWTLGGCDYHDGTQTSGDQKDLEIGIEIGRSVELAYQTGKPFFFQLLTDGGCGAVMNTRQWGSDAGDKCMTVMGYFDPKGPPKMIRDQVGHYTDGQGAERATLIGSDPQLVGYAVLANYLNICGKLADFHTYAPGVFTGAGQLDKLLIFEGKTSA